MAVGGSTNVMLHAPEIARAAGYSNFSADVMSAEEFNHLSTNVVPVIVDARPFGRFSMVDIDARGGIQVFVKDLLDAGLLNGDVLTCTGETLAEQLARLDPPAPDGDVIHSVAKPYKPTGGLRVLGGNLSPEFSAVLKLAGVEGGLENNIFAGRAKVFDGEQKLLEMLDGNPNHFEDGDMIATLKIISSTPVIRREMERCIRKTQIPLQTNALHRQFYCGRSGIKLRGHRFPPRYGCEQLALSRPGGSHQRSPLGAA